MKYIENWIFDYLKKMVSFPITGLKYKTKHILFLFVNHFELAGKEPRLSEWLTKYPKLAIKHFDFDGYNPKQTWFYALDLLREHELEAMKDLISEKFGEIELHWHHNNDSVESFTRKLRDGLSIFQKYGFFYPINNQAPACFGFIHGNWSLNNARGVEYCGVDNEIELLKSAGCYGDFTFPALFSKSQPHIINSIYYANFKKGTAGYFRGRIAEVGKSPKVEEFLMFQGPLTINWYDWRFKWHPMIEDGEIGKSNSHGDPKRIDAWIRQGIHVKGRPEWVFIKVFCHGGQDYSEVLGDSTDKMFSHLEKKYNDGDNYKLHYISAREAFNLVRAAEDGNSGDPNIYRNYVIPPPLVVKRVDNSD